MQIVKFDGVVVTRWMQHHAVRRRACHHAQADGAIEDFKKVSSPGHPEGKRHRSRDADQTRRLLALAAIYDGGSRSDAAQTGGVGVQIVRDWVVRFNAKGFDGLLNGKAPGARSILDDSQGQALRRIVEDGPIPAVHSIVRWRLIDLAQWVFEEFRVSISKQTLSRELRTMGFRKLSARPRHHAQNMEATADFKKLL
jgi:transposase